MNIIESIFLNFDGKTSKEKKKNCADRAISSEVGRILQAQRKLTMEVQNG